MLNGIELCLQGRGTAEERVAEAIEELANDLAAGKSESLEAYLHFLSRFHEYSLGNALLIAVQRSDATLVAGRRYWEKMGRTIKPHEKPIRIFAPMTRPVLELDAESGEDFEVEQLLGFRLVSVFDVEQTEGASLPQLNRTVGDATSLIPVLERVITEGGLRVTYDSMPFGTNGWTDGKTVAIRQDLGSAEKFRCLVHEWAHCLLEHISLRRDTSKRVRETEAEAVACVVCHAFEINARGRSRDYIHLWNGNSDTLMQSLNAVQRVAGTIITQLDLDLERSVPIGTEATP